MSYYEEQENIYALHDLAKNSGQFRRRRRRGDALLQKKLADQVIVSKTLLDPANTLSNRAKKRLQKEESCNDLHSDVQYSLNKHQRWKTVSLISKPLTSQACTWRKMGRSTRFPRKEKDKNFPTSKQHCGNGETWKRTKLNRQKFSSTSSSLTLFSKFSPEKLSEIIKRGLGQQNLGKRTTALTCRMRAAATTKTKKNSRTSLTLGDFLTSSSPPKSTERTRQSSSWSFIDAKPECSAKNVQPKPADLVDISAVTHASSMFEVIDIQTRTLQNFDFREMISLLEDKRVVVRWIDSDRVMVDVTYQVRLSGDEPIRKPLLILFMELRDDARILRIRINANARYLGAMDREAFLHSAKRQKDFMSLFQLITDTVRSLRLKERDIRKEKTRCSDNPSYFAPEVNSQLLAEKSDRCHEYDRLQFLREVERATDQRLRDESEHHPSVCCRCSPSKQLDLFATNAGMACRDCITSNLVHQLRLDRAPVDVPLKSTENVTSIDLLYAVLPAPLISELIKVSIHTIGRASLSRHLVAVKVPPMFLDVDSPALSLSVFIALA
ncbi:hypothetical protein COOONC_10840 [Cooperia oncophora]